MMSLEWSLLIAVVAGWFVSMLMNRGQFELRYCAAAFAGALAVPYVAGFLVLYWFSREVSPEAFAGLQPRCAGAFIACLLFDGAKRLS